MAITTTLEVLLLPDVTSLFSGDSCLYIRYPQGLALARKVYCKPAVSDNMRRRQLNLPTAVGPRAAYGRIPEQYARTTHIVGTYSAKGS